MSILHERSLTHSNSGVSPQPTAIAMNAKFAGGLPGGGGPEMRNFDPLKLSEKSPDWVPFFREAE